MKKTVTANIANTLFYIDEDAYIELMLYLKTLAHSLKKHEDITEIIFDIEMRISELLLKKTTNNKQIISKENIDEVIAIIGNPKDYEIEDNTQKTDFHSYRKKLYRDINNSYIGGVCAGLGFYLGVSILLLRIVLVLLTLFSWGGFIIIYIVFWILVPAAITTDQKLDMMGTPIDVEEKVKEEFNRFSNKVKSTTYYGRFKKTFKNLFSGTS